MTSFPVNGETGAPTLVNSAKGRSIALLTKINAVNDRLSISRIPLTS